MTKRFCWMARTLIISLLWPYFFPRNWSMTSKMIDVDAKAIETGLTSDNLLIICGISIMNMGSMPTNPRSPGICPTITTLDMARRNPTIIGSERRSKMNPKLRSPNISDQNPTVNDTAAPMTGSGTLNGSKASIIRPARTAVVDVGPVLMSRLKISHKSLVSWRYANQTLVVPIIA